MWNIQKFWNHEKKTPSQKKQMGWELKYMQFFCNIKWIIYGLPHKVFLPLFKFRLPFSHMLNCMFDRFIYETEHFNGVAELLEILGRYVYSFIKSYSNNKIAFFIFRRLAIYYFWFYLQSYNQIECNCISSICLNRKKGTLLKNPDSICCLPSCSFFFWSQNSDARRAAGR